MRQRQLKALGLWLFMAALGLLWGLSIYVFAESCALHMPLRPWCGGTTIGIIAIPLIISGMLGFILGKRFGNRQTTRGMEHEFD